MHTLGILTVTVCVTRMSTYILSYYMFIIVVITYWYVMVLISAVYHCKVCLQTFSVGGYQISNRRLTESS